MNKDLLIAAIIESRQFDRTVPVALTADDISDVLSTIELAAGVDVDYAEENDGSYDVWGLEGQPFRLSVTLKPIETITLYYSGEHWIANGTVASALGIESDQSPHFGDILADLQDKVFDILASRGYRVEFTHLRQSVGVGSIVTNRAYTAIVADAVGDAVAELALPQYTLVSEDDWYAVPDEFVGPHLNEGVAADVIDDLEDAFAAEHRDDNETELPSIVMVRVDSEPS